MVEGGFGGCFLFCTCDTQLDFLMYCKGSSLRPMAHEDLKSFIL